MIEKNPASLTFALLDRERGVPELAPAFGREYPFPAWYRSVREVPLNELSVEDISKAIRQSIHLEHVVPLALRRLEAEPLAGEMYDGELLVSLKSVPLDYWPKHEAERLSLKSAIEAALQEEAIADNVRQDAGELLHKTTRDR
jgi:hypothetical protein